MGIGHPWHIPRRFIGVDHRGSKYTTEVLVEPSRWVIRYIAPSPLIPTCFATLLIRAAITLIVHALDVCIWVCVHWR